MVDDSELVIKIRCPVCNKRGDLKIKENVIAKSERGITVNVANYLICQHSFLVYIDKDLKVKDSFICDFEKEVKKGLLFCLNRFM